MTGLIFRTVIAALLGAAMVWALTRSVPPTQFRELKWPIVISAALFWTVLTSILLIIFWDDYFAFFKAAWLRWWNPALAGIFYGVVGLLLWWLASRSPRQPAAVFCVLGGLWSIPEHLLGFYRFNILDIPILQDVSALEILVFAFFEYVIYWAIVFGLALAVDFLLQFTVRRRSILG